MIGKSTLVLLGLSSLVAVSLCADLRAENKPTQTESDKKKPNILKEYTCLRDGELCHPDFAKNRGMYVSCANGVAWEQQCPKCVYHPLACPTKSLWFDGEKCDWASPKLASQPCIDKIQANPYEPANDQSIFQSLEPVAQPQPNYDYHMPDKNRWPGNANKPAPMPSSSNQGQSSSFKPPKHKFSPEYVDSNQMRIDSNKEIENNQGSLEELVKAEQVRSPVGIRDFPLFPRLDDAPPVDGTKMIKLREAVYAMVDSDNGKPVMMKIAEPFVLEESANDPLPNMNIIGEDSFKA